MVSKKVKLFIFLTLKVILLLNPIEQPNYEQLDFSLRQGSFHEGSQGNFDLV